ncbi:MAG: phosphoribosylglycinamide formyltransferase [Phycisphaeraceae bacterium]|nr:phosphoribosylglycinamide formyltransferase [Phycisphaeraceae bacterium]MBX3405683.1 phosphoribosylglycinamide formyltransferase [Phycisphaeraceae bacterium]
MSPHASNARGAARVPVIAMISGSGRTLANLLEHAERGTSRAHIAMVVASRPCAGEELARGRGIATIIEPREIDAARLEALAREAGASWIVLAGYLRRLGIPPSLVNRVVNIHPALLPSFGGEGMYGRRVHRAVLDAGCKVSGCTVHLCDDEYDRGPIIAQAACPVLDDDTPESLAARVFELECRTYPVALEQLLAGRVRVEGRCARIVSE